ncbi:MAG: hypothetical protein ACI8QC_001619 [Planctomycetota bacterium]|jgi:hypothetical protein
MPSKQALILTLLLGGSAAVWVPQIRARMSSASPFEQSVPAGLGIPDASALSVTEVPLEESSDELSEVDLEEPGTELDQHKQGESSTSTAGLEALLGSMRSFRPELAVTLEPEVGVEPSEPLVDTVLPRSMLRSGLEDLLEPYPLTAILHAPTGKRVVMGARVFSEGDSPEPGAVIERIEARAVWFKYGGTSLRVVLPALVVRSSRSDNQLGTVDEGSPAESTEIEAESESEALPTDGV